MLGDPGAVDEPVRRALAARRDALEPLAGQLRALAAEGRLGRPLTELCRSYVHLHCNRLLGTGPPFEPQILGLLLRTRESLERAPLRPK